MTLQLPNDNIEISTASLSAAELAAHEREGLIRLRKEPTEAILAGLIDATRRSQQNFERIAQQLPFDGSAVQHRIIEEVHVKEKTITGELIVEGAIEGVHIKAGSISADMLEAGSVTADLLDVDELSAISADLGTVTAGTLTGGTVQTAESGGRVVIDHLGIRGINASEVEKFNFDATSGILTATAVISAETGSEIPTDVLAGQIEETQIEDESISTPKLQANIVEAKHMAVDELSAISADIGSVTAGTLTGVLFQTSASDPRVYFDGDGFHATDAEGGGVVDIPSDGSTATLTGKLAARGLTLPEAADPEIKEINQVSWVDPSGDVSSFVAAFEQFDQKAIRISANHNGESVGSGGDGSIYLRAYNDAGDRAGVLLTASNAQDVRVFAGSRERQIIGHSGDSNFLQLPSLVNRRIVSGAVLSSGAQFEFGTGGWSSTRVNEGRYRVYFSPALSSRPIVQVTPFSDDSQVFVRVRPDNTYVSQFEVEFFDGSFEDEDESFSFMAIG